MLAIRGEWRGLWCKRGDEGVGRGLGVVEVDVSRVCFAFLSGEVGFWSFVISRSLTSLELFRDNGYFKLLRSAGDANLISWSRPCECVLLLLICS
jgi:hypothetical protein